MMKIIKGDLKLTKCFRFPKTPKKRAQWIAAIRRQDWQPSKYSTLCSEHFIEQDFDRSSLVCVRLREHAVPSIFPAFSSYLQKVGIHT